MIIEKLSTKPKDSSFESGNISNKVIITKSPTQDKEAASLEYLNNKASLYLNRSSPYMQGTLALTYTPTSNNHIVNKDYITTVNSTRDTSAIDHFNTSIQNLLSKNGGQVTGDFILNANPVDPKHLATLQYLNNKLSSLTASSVTNPIPTGTIIRVTSNFVYSTTAYLRCNGASVLITSYGNLFNVIGHNFDVSNPNPTTHFMLPYLSVREIENPDYIYIIKT